MSIQIPFSYLRYDVQFREMLYFNYFDRRKKQFINLSAAASKLKTLLVIVGQCALQVNILRARNIEFHLFEESSKA